MKHFKDIYTEVSTQVLTARKEICVLHPASVPSNPSQPIKIYHVGLAGFLSLMISISLVYVFNYLNIQLFVKNKKTINKNHENISLKTPSSENSPDKAELLNTKSLKGIVSVVLYFFVGISAMALSALVYYFFKKLGY